MSTDDWTATGRQIAASIAATPQWTCSETHSEMADLPPRPKATRGHRQAVAEIGLRYRPANAADMEAHRLRLELLACDLSEISPALIRQAGDRVAQHSQFMPKASEILAAAREIVAERQRAPRDGVSVNADGEIIGHDERPIGEVGENYDRCRDINRRLASEGAVYRVFPVGAHNMGRVQVVDDGTIVPNHVCNGDGTFRHKFGHYSGLWPRV